MPKRSIPIATVLPLLTAGAYWCTASEVIDVRQTFSTLSMRLLTAESHSELVGTEIVCSADRQYCVSGVYRNEPRFEVRDRSEMHYGAVWLRIITQPTKQLIGHYWTDRATAGEMELNSRRRKKFQTFDGARAYFDSI